MASRGRPPHPGPLTPAEERVLACVREGMPNAEIAVRLGVSVNTVRYHVSNLLAKAGAASREELGRWRPRSGEGGGRSRGWAGLLLAKPVALVIALVAVASVGVFFFAPLPKEEVEPVELPEPFTRPDADELRAQGFVDAGEFLRSEGEGDLVHGHSPRELFSVLKLRPGEFLVGESERITPRPFISGNYWFTVTVRVVEVRYYVAIRVMPARGNPEEPPHSAESGVSVRFETSASTDVLLSAYRSDAGDLSPHQVTETHRVTLSADGHLWMQPEPLSGGAVYDAWTGERLAIESGLIGWLDPSPASILFTGCDEGRCYVSYRTHQPLLAPAGGVLTCESPTTLLLDQESVVLRIDWADTGYGGNPQFQCEPHHVRTGDRIGPERHYRLTAYDGSGQQISLGITPDGHLYAGDFATTIACPCRQGT